MKCARTPQKKIRILFLPLWDKGMISNVVFIVTLCAIVAVSQAGLLPAAVHYSSAAAVSSQSIVRHDQPALATKLVAAAPVAKLAVAAPAVYHAAPAVYHSAPAVYHSAPAPAVYHSAPAPAVYHAAPVHYAAPVAKVLAQPEEIAYPKYDFTYSVADGHTGDNKSQQESRDGDVVKGSYSFHEADGSIRTVEYSADDHSGFNAVVHNTAPTAAPAIIKTPVYTAHAPAYYH
ncbi:Cuticle protein 8 [Papilio xuthus]|uniref:Cuticle protein 8 n=1 Tax=Papilio xuthus TaxID=66420 RepID=A0A194Q302_PAPXU|nr:Cuticle protein 8 [Papilio xuthus]